MIDTFKAHARSLTSPPEDAMPIEPSDSGTLAHVTRALYVGDAGHLTVRMKSGAIVTLRSVPAGSLLPLRVEQVLDSGTSAQGIVGFW